MAEYPRSAPGRWTVPVLFVLVYLITGFAALRGGVRSLTRHALRQLYDGSISGAGTTAVEEMGLAVAPLLLFALAWLLTDLGLKTTPNREGLAPPAGGFESLRASSGPPPQPDGVTGYARTPRPCSGFAWR
jgi:hypothetical protein